MPRDRTMPQSSERGIAMILALFMVLVLSTLGSSLMFLAETETWSSANYRLTAQSRYAAESGVQKAAHHLLYEYVPPGTVLDPIASYDLTASPVTFNGAPVVLSGNPAVPSNYPVAAAQDAFDIAAQGAFGLHTGVANYTASATLLSMRQFTDPFSGAVGIIQRWQITGEGRVSGPRSSRVEVAAVVERQLEPAFEQSAFATDGGCGALTFTGNASTDSYDSSAPLQGGQPVLSDSGGSVGTNGNLSATGNATVNGTLSSPGSGVGSCTAGGVTAETLTGNATVTGGLTQVAQPTTYPTPPAPNPLPPTNTQNFADCTGLPSCTSSGSVITITPPSPTSQVMFGNIDLSGNKTVHLNAGIYVVNSLSMSGNTEIIIDSGPVVFQIAGQGVTDVISIAGDGISDASYNPANLQFVYGGTGNISLDSATMSGTLYAPNATGAFSGNADFYGAVILKQLAVSGNAAVHYDRKLQTSSLVTAGNYTMSSFTWKSF